MWDGGRCVLTQSECSINRHQDPAAKRDMDALMKIQLVAGYNIVASAACVDGQVSVKVLCQTHGSRRLTHRYAFLINPRFRREVVYNSRFSPCCHDDSDRNDAYDEYDDYEGIDGP